MGYKELNETLTEMITEFQRGVEDIKIALLVVDKQHRDRVRTRSSEDKD